MTPEVFGGLWGCRMGVLSSTGGLSKASQMGQVWSESLRRRWEGEECVCVCVAGCFWLIGEQCVCEFSCEQGLMFTAGG